MPDPDAKPNGPRRFFGDRLVIASHNPGKVREIAALLGPWCPHLISSGDLGLPEPEETGDSFVANARLKAHAAATAAALPALADDSGLVIPALGGAPGIHSARWGGPAKDFAMAMARVRAELDAVGAPAGADHGPAAWFACALSLAWPDGHDETVEGRVTGTLTAPPRGDRGFGYDPIFVPDGRRLTFAEMDPGTKHAISHRADAFRRLVARCFATA